MILKNRLLEVIVSQKTNLNTTKPLTNRNLFSKINIDSNLAIVISGIRRSGKSTLLWMLMQKIGNFNYFNFEDSRITDFEIADFEKLYELQNELNPNCDYFFFDEIQNIDKWEIFIRTLLDRNKKVYITGSNASLLSYELGTKLTGRNLRYELFPFSYTESLKFKNIEANEFTFQNYINDGGFPEYLIENNIKILQELFNDILYRDIFVRHSIRNTKILKDLTLYLISNVGKEISYNNLKNIFGLGSVNTVISFLEYLENSYLIFLISKFDYSFKKQVVSPKKVYAIDSGLIKSNTVSFSSDLGRILENIIFIELKQRGLEIYFYKEKNECDFIIKEGDKITQLFQVCYNLTEENKSREINGLLEAMKKFNIDEAKILTFNQDDNFIIEDKKIIVESTWKWLIR